MLTEVSGKYDMIYDMAWYPLHHPFFIINKKQAKYIKLYFKVIFF